MTEIGSIIDGKYEILKEVGRGGMSYVYLAMDTHLNKQWAVKEIKKVGDSQKDGVYVNSLIAEADIITKLDHPALPRIVDIIDNGITLYIIMDYVEGESLDKKIKKEGAQPEEEVIGWAKQICAALDYLHSRKPPIIYRDMKPANIMLKPEGTIKVIDFGIAREYKEQEQKDTIMFGTPGYAPPEQLVNNGQTDARSDIFAFGMTMFHLITGIAPGSISYNEVRNKISELLSESMGVIVDRCVEIDPGARYQNCEDLLYDLEHPEFITRDHRKKQKKKLIFFSVSAALSLLCMLSCIICSKVSVTMYNNNYDVLISTSAASSLEDKIKSYKDAIEIYPDRVDAYIKMLEAYEDEGRFGKAENDEFLAVYNAHKDKFDSTSSDVAELNYKIGMMYFNYYMDGDDTYNFSTRVQKAYSFFMDNNKNAAQADFSDQKKSDCYYQICSFYKKYILSQTTVEEASKENYESLFETIRSTLNDMQDTGAYDQLSLYNGIFMLLYDQRISMAQVNVEKEDILTLLEEVYERTLNLSVQKEQSVKLQQEILDNYGEYKEAVERAYVNVKERY